VGVVYYYYTRIWTLQIASSVAVKKKYWKREIRGRGLYKEGRDNKENSKILGKLIAPIAPVSPVGGLHVCVTLVLQLTSAEPVVMTDYSSCFTAKSISALCKTGKYTLWSTLEFHVTSGMMTSAGWLLLSTTERKCCLYHSCSKRIPEAVMVSDISVVMWSEVLLWAKNDLGPHCCNSVTQRSPRFPLLQKCVSEWSMVVQVAQFLGKTWLTDRQTRTGPQVFAHASAWKAHQDIIMVLWWRE